MVEEFDDDRTAELLKALRDPLRRRMLMVLGEDEDYTIRQVAARLGQSTRRIRHQMDSLVSAGLVAVHAERPRRGTMERTFRAVDQPPLWAGEWPGVLAPDEMKLFLLDSLRSIFENMTAAIVGATFLDREGWCATRLLRKVDARGWDELAKIHERAVREAMSVTDRSARRLEKSGEDPIRASSSLLLFELPPLE